MSLCIYNNVQLYLYSCQDLILESNALQYNVKAGDFYQLQINTSEIIKVYSTHTSGIMILNYNILQECKHNQIIYHKLNNGAMLCEIKPFQTNENSHYYTIKSANIRVVKNIDNTLIYFNGKYYGTINQNCDEVKFDKVNKNNEEYGIIYLSGEKKYLIVFTITQVVFCGQYIDNEVLKDCIQIYIHNPNMFNIGTLVKFSFDSQQLSYKSISDRGEERKHINNEFNIIYFLDAIKCGRYKYAYNKLTYELKAEINIDVLSKYFPTFDRYVYIANEDTYLTLHNNKVVGVYHFSVKDNMFNNIY